ncbi:hypothetical protein HY991_03145 [Candidatus Micrarchaeota archaeon]|nr:hypothetical protein [Candidatus Micrarchaeota archaeon]
MPADGVIETIAVFLVIFTLIGYVKLDDFFIFIIVGYPFLKFAGII